MRKEVADLLLGDVVVAKVEPGSIPGLKKWREIVVTPKVGEQVVPIPPGPAQECDQKKVNTPAMMSVSSPSASSSGLAPVDVNRAWVVPRSSVAKLHVSTLDSMKAPSPTWLCCQSAKDKFLDATYRGQGLMEGVTAAKLMKRKICESCLSHLSEETVKVVSQRLLS